MQCKAKECQISTKINYMHEQHRTACSGHGLSGWRGVGVGGQGAGGRANIP